MTDANIRIDLPRQLQDKIERAATTLREEFVGEDEPYFINARIDSDASGPFISVDLITQSSVEEEE